MERVRSEPQRLALFDARPAVFDLAPLPDSRVHFPVAAGIARVCPYHARHLGRAHLVCNVRLLGASQTGLYFPISSFCSCYPVSPELFSIERKMADPETHVCRDLFVTRPESVWADGAQRPFTASEPLFLTSSYCLMLKATLCAVRNILFLFVSSVLD